MGFGEWCFFCSLFVCLCCEFVGCVGAWECGCEVLGLVVRCPFCGVCYERFGTGCFFVEDVTRGHVCVAFFA